MLEGILSKVLSNDTMCERGYEAYCPQLAEVANEYGFGTVAAVVGTVAAVVGGAYALYQNKDAIADKFSKSATSENDDVVEVSKQPRRSARLAAKNGGEK